ncbi:tRNA-splicing endonuclease [uncultured archaeon]|nr:tRNA-splicing endonuclease [uncultured archaeon]
MEPISVSDAASVELFRKYGAGVEEGGKVKLHPLEALYFIERGKLKLEGETFDSLMAKVAKEDKLAGEKYAILKHLRQNGYILRPSFADEPWLRVYRKGFRPGEDRTQYLLKVVEAGWQPPVEELMADMKKAAEVRKELVYAIVQNGKPLFFKTVRTSFD